MPEKKAYDLKLLLEKLKAQGLDLAEDAAEKVVIGTFDWLEESADLSPNVYDDIAKIVYPQIKKSALGLVDKIDGHVG